MPFLLVDETDKGPIYDPLKSSYFYTYTPSSSPHTTSAPILGTFTPLRPTPDAPTSFLRFAGHWGDAEYAADDPRQKGKNLLGFKKYVGGPTGPGDKQLERKEAWPENEWSKGQKVKTKLEGRGWWKGVWGKVVSLGKGKGKKKERKVKRVKVSGEVVGRDIVFEMC